MAKNKINSTDDLYDEISNELDYLGGILSIVECLAAGQYEGADNCMETLLAQNRNGFMTIIYDSSQRFERVRELIREMHEKMPAEAVTA